MEEKKTRKKCFKIIFTSLCIIILLIILSVILNEELLGPGSYGDGQGEKPDSSVGDGTGDNQGQDGSETGGNQGGNHGGNQSGTHGGENQGGQQPGDEDGESGDEDDGPGDETDDGTGDEGQGDGSDGDDYEIGEGVIDDIYVIMSENKTWGITETINVFNNKYYKESKIAPGVEGDYVFTVNNGLDHSVAYKMSLEEINNMDINMKYKIKLNGEYIVSEWTDISDINLDAVQIERGTKDDYVLEWKWVDAENDTEIGISAENAIYIININIKSQI